MKRIALKQFLFVVVGILSVPAMAITVTGPQNGQRPPRQPGYPPAPPPRQPAPPPPRHPAPPPRPMPPRPPRPVPPPQPPQPPPGYGYQQQQTIYFNRPYANTRLPLRQLMGLDYRFSGMAVDRVEVLVRGQTYYNAELVLLVNGYQEDRLRPYGYYNSLIVRGYKRMDWEIGQLELLISGQVFVEAVTVYFNR